MLKAAVIGVGSMGRNHVRVYRELEGIQLVAVSDQNKETASRVGGIFNTPHFTDYLQMIEECKPDLVTLAVPTDKHYTIGLSLIERGVNLLIEKPIAPNLDEAADLVEQARRNDVILAVGHIERFNPAIIELRRRLREGMAGRIYNIHAQRLSPYPVRIRDAGVVIDLASHDIDLMRYLIDQPVTRLYGETLKSINSDREDMFNGIMRFQGGTVGVLDVNWITPKKVRLLTVTGARGMFSCDLLSQELFFYENETAPSQWDALSVLRGVNEGNILGIRVQRHEPLAAELADFVSAVRESRDPTVPGCEGLETLRIALDFVRSGQDVEIIRQERVLA
jgi:predicted dehydrogenase